MKGRIVGQIVFRISDNEGAPIVLVGYCQPNYRDSIIKNLKRLSFQKQSIPSTTGQGNNGK